MLLQNKPTSEFTIRQSFAAEKQAAKVKPFGADFLNFLSFPGNPQAATVDSSTPPV
jgi:hypothetical protein